MADNKEQSAGVMSDNSDSQAMPTIWLVNYKTWWVAKSFSVCLFHFACFYFLFKTVFLCVIALAMLKGLYTRISMKS